MAAILPLQPSTKEVLNNPNSLNNLMKISYEQQKQAASDTAYDTKTNIYENFEVKEVDENLRNNLEEKNDLSSLQFDGDGLKMANIKNHELIKDDKDVGLVLSSIFDGKALKGLALIKFDDIEDEKKTSPKIGSLGDNIFLQNNKVLIID